METKIKVSIVKYVKSILIISRCVLKLETLACRWHAGTRTPLVPPVCKPSPTTPKTSASSSARARGRCWEPAPSFSPSPAPLPILSFLPACFLFRGEGSSVYGRSKGESWQILKGRVVPRPQLELDLLHMLRRRLGPALQCSPPPNSGWAWHVSSRCIL